MRAFERLCEIAGPVSRETFSDLNQFENRFRKWARRINLASSATIPVLWERHILDSAQLAALKPEPKNWLDLGSGGGFPGAVVAILLKDRPGARCDLVESNRKKAAFLTTVLGELNAPAKVHTRRIEDVHDAIPICDVVTARALAALPALLELASPWLQAGAFALFQKGRDYRAELEESRDAWEFDLVEHASRTDAEGVVLEIAHLRRKTDTAGAATDERKP